VLHDSPTGAHCGRDRLLYELQKRFCWPGMATQAEQYVLTCDSCQRNKHSKQLTPGLLMPLPAPEEPCLHSQHAKRAIYNRLNLGLEGSCNTYNTVVTYNCELLQLWVQLHHLQLRVQLRLTTVSYNRLFCA